MITIVIAQMNQIETIDSGAGSKSMLKNCFDLSQKNQPRGWKINKSRIDSVCPVGFPLVFLSLLGFFFCTLMVLLATEVAYQVGNGPFKFVGNGSDSGYRLNKNNRKLDGFDQPIKKAVQFVSMTNKFIFIS